MSQTTDLSAQTSSGVKWTSLSMVVVTLLHLATIVILARFLEAEEFGLIAIILVVTGFSQAFMDMGISSAIIQRQDATHEQLSSLYWLNIVSGSALGIIVFFASPFVAGFYEQPLLTPMLQILASVFLIISIGNQYRILCQKEMQFRRMAIGEMMAAFCAFGVAVTAAINGSGVFALVYAMLMQAAVTSLYFLVVGLRYHHRPALIYRHKTLKGYFSFGFYQMGERSVNYLSANIDSLIIGKFLGMEALGFYNLAWQICIFPVQKINPIVNKVAFPVYAKIQSDKAALNENYGTFMRAVAVITLPLLTFFFFFPDEIVRIVYGEGWEQTAMLLPILALVGIFKAMGNPVGPLFLAIGRADIGFWWGLSWTILLSLSYVTVLSFIPTIEAVALTLLGLVAAVGCVWHTMASRIVGIKYLPILKNFFKTVIVCFGIGFIGFLSATMTGFASPILTILTGAAICGILYLPYMAVMEKDLIRLIKK